MRALSCISAGGLRGRGIESLGEADRLRLERHLSSCESCRAAAHMDESLRQLADASPGPSARAQDRAIHGAFAQAHDQGVRPLRSERRAPWLVLAGVAVAAALVLTWTTWQGGAAKHPSAGGLQAGVPTRMDDATRVSLAHATVDAAAGTELVWSPEDTTVDLRAGAVDVDVDASRGLPFRVKAPGFRVDVLGTRFRVTVQGVSVTRGRVRVVRDGVAGAVELAAGQEWRVGQADVVGTAVRTDTEPDTEVATATESHPDPKTSTETPAKREAATNPRGLDRPSPVERAEALTRQAEAALTAGKRAEAIRLYLQVAEKYPRLLAGEVALFAAARLSAGERKTRLFEQYLERYPRGQFSAEARKLLAAAKEIRK